MERLATLAVLSRRVESCRRCPRLVAHRESIARTKRRAFSNWEYWGRPVSGFGDPHADLFILGLAPAAHGANRTGRVFTGDRSGDFLYSMLHRAGFANQPTSTHRDDGLRLIRTYVSATVRCAPPANKPLPEEILNCRPFLETELALLRPNVVLALGRIAFDGYLRLLRERNQITRTLQCRFAHGAQYQLPDGLPYLVASYHPSQQNTQTGRLTPTMFMRVLRQIKRHLSAFSDK